MLEISSIRGFLMHLRRVHIRQVMKVFVDELIQLSSRGDERQVVDENQIMIESVNGRISYVFREVVS